MNDRRDIRDRRVYQINQEMQIMQKMLRITLDLVPPGKRPANAQALLAKFDEVQSACEVLDELIWAAHDEIVIMRAELEKQVK